jgi:catechol 2,3-dioxygenase-like lactoylglutathione lyase family enzyme
MITGAHVLLYSQNPDADRAFLRDVLQFRGVDAGGGWLIFKLPPAEVALHPADGEMKLGQHVLPAQFYLMCDDLPSLMKSLEAKHVSCTAVTKERWGIRTTIRLPSGGELGLYQPTHPTALSL